MSIAFNLFRAYKSSKRLISESCLMTCVQCFGDNGDEVGSTLNIARKRKFILRIFNFVLINLILHWHVNRYMTWRNGSWNDDVTRRARSRNVVIDWRAWSRYAMMNDWRAWSWIMNKHWWASSWSNDSWLEFVMFG